MRTNVISTCRRPYTAVRYSTHFSLQRSIIVEKNPSVNAFVSVSQEQPSEILNNSLPLSNVSIAVKDNIATRLLPTTCSSAMLKEYTSPFDATVVKLLQEAGATIFGKTNCDEFGMGSLNTHSIHGQVVNPIDTSEQRSAGGSSGGSAAAVAAGMCDAALGTDTGGSVRLPASYCGVVGFKPSYGLISRWGVISYADSLDCVGVLSSNVDKTKRVFDAICTYDPLDPTAASPSIREQAFSLTSQRISSSSSILPGLRVGVPQEYFPAELAPGITESIRDIIKDLKSQGATIIPISLPSTSYALSSYYVLASAEASSNLSRYDGIEYGLHIRPPPGTDITKTSNVYAHTRSSGFGPEVQKRILLGTYALTADAFDNYFLQAQRIRRLIQDDFDRVFTTPNHFSDSTGTVETKSDSPSIDLILHPSSIRTAPLLSENKSDLDAYVQDTLTVPASLAGLPALSVPIKSKRREERGKGSTWPVGLGLVGQWGTDQLVLAVGKAIETLHNTNGS